MLIKKNMIALFIDNGKEGNEKGWVRIRKGTAFDLALNPIVNEREYIADARPVSEVDGYKPSLNEPVTMYDDQEDYKLLFPLAHSLPSGEKARRDVLIVFSFEPVTEGGTTTVYARAASYESGADYYSESGGVYTKETISDETDFTNFSGDLYTRSTETSSVIRGYKAWKTNATLSFTNINAMDSTLTTDITFGGTIEKGYATPDATTHKVTFTRTEDDDGEWVDPFEQS